MAIRIAGFNLPDNKRIAIALTYVYGIGRSLAEKILKELNINLNLKAKELTEEQINNVRKKIESSIIVGGELERQKILNIKRLKEIGSYRGSRHSKGLPVRGQRTKTNTRTVRGNKRTTMGSGRKVAEKK